MGADDEAVLYRRRLSHMADASDGRVFFNKNLRHTSIAIATIIEKSSNYIYVITDDLDVDIYGTAEILSSLRTFVQKSNTSDIKVISKCPVPLDHPWRSDDILLTYQDHFAFISLPERWSISYYFVLGDGKNFRYEHENREYVPVVQFGNPEMGAHLRVRFEELEFELKEQFRHNAA